MSALAPVLIGALLLLALLLLPLAARLARQLRRGQRERETLLQRAIDASDAERRRIAQDLHDGVVQDLAGSAFELEANARAPARPEEERGLFAAVAGRLRGSVRDLRRLLVEIYPPDLHKEGLREAINETVPTWTPNGLRAELDIPDDLELSPGAESLLFRGAQEALRNVVAHAGASRVGVRAAQRPRLCAADGQRQRPRLRSRQRRARQVTSACGPSATSTVDAGGRLEVDSEPGRGTTVVIEVPVP